MGCNIEIKAYARDADRLRRDLKFLASDGPEFITQRDSFYHSRSGRLKLRRFENGRGELIYYERGDAFDPSPSEYKLVPIDEPEGLHSALEAALGCRGWVRKRRELYRIGQTRVHLDVVEELGDFLELEVVLRDGQSREDGISIAGAIMSHLGVEDEDLVEKAYIDLLVTL